MSRSTEVVNARLLRVSQEAGAAGGEAADTFEAGIGAATAGQPPEGSEKWAGDVGVFYDETRQRIPQGGDVNVVVIRSLEVAGDLGLTFETGDVVTFRRLEFGAPAEESGSVQAVEADQSPPGVPGQIRLTLEKT